VYTRKTAIKNHIVHLEHTKVPEESATSISGSIILLPWRWRKEVTPKFRQL